MMNEGEPARIALDSDLDATGLSRRAVLQAGLFAALGGTATAVGIVGGAELIGGAQLVGASPNRVGTSRSHSAPELNRASDLAALERPSAPVWTSTWADPIRRLDAVVARRTGMAVARQAIMLTIDDGPHPLWTPRYLRLLAKYHITATFNVIGQQVAANKTLLKAMVGEGHHIGNHTFQHPLNLPSLSTARIRHELVDTTDAIVRASGFRPRQFRSPGGAWGPNVLAEAARQQMLPLGWDIDPRDWALPGVAEIRRAMLAARPHDIILCHDGGGDRSQTYRALQTVLPALLSRGYEFVTLPAPQ